MQHKRIRCISSNVIAAYSQAEEPWADVWVQWKERPGRPRRRYGPTLMARADVVGEVERWTWCIEHYRAVGDHHMEAFARAELPAAQALLQQLDAVGYLCDFGDDGNRATPNLYTAAEWLTRATAEALLARWLRTEHGICQPKFEWDRPRIFVRSM